MLKNFLTLRRNSFSRTELAGALTCLLAGYGSSEPHLLWRCSELNHQASYTSMLLTCSQFLEIRTNDFDNVP